MVLEDENDQEIQDENHTISECIDENLEPALGDESETSPKDPALRDDDIGTHIEMRLFFDVSLSPVK